MKETAVESSASAWLGGGDNNYSTFFKRATGHAAYLYQERLGKANEPPPVLDVPTGSGKTQALICSWLYQRRERDNAPRRLVYALPMRSLVEQTRDVALDIRERLGIYESELPIHVLMGGETAADWRIDPQQDQILIGTVDMLLSRALNRGYAESRFAWPVSFGLLNSDCRWVLDETQLMGPALTTSAQLAGLREKLGTALPCETIWASATVETEQLKTFDHPEVGDVLALPDEDRTGSLASTLEAFKRLTWEDLSEITPRKHPASMAESALQAHEPESRSLIVVNKVSTAQSVFTELLKRTKKGSDAPPKIVLLHSRYRPPDRRRHMEEALGQVVGPGMIVVATQVIEAGVDTSARLLATETAPFSSIVQRLGRCNRYGEHDDTQVLWFDRGDKGDDKSAAPYLQTDLVATAAALRELEGQSLSPSMLNGVEVKQVQAIPATLRRRDLVDFFDTSPDLSGMDIDVAPFIREDDDRSVTVFFRDIGSDRDALHDAAHESAPGRDELASVPFIDLKEAIKATDRHAWIYDYVDAQWCRRRHADVVPGETLMLRSTDGGYTSETGWDRGVEDVVPIEQQDVAVPQEPESFGSEEENLERSWVSLADHLADVQTQARALIEDLSDLAVPAGAAEAIVVAAALHDIGKAHKVFQKTLLSEANDEERERLNGVLLAKSAKRGRHERKHFRHELASALALLSADGAIDLGPERDLVVYLVGAHHGKVRLSIRPAPAEEPPDDNVNTRFALGIVEGDELPEVRSPLGSIAPSKLDLSCMELGGNASWTRRAVALRDRDDLGPFRLGYLEALLRIADWRGSA